MMPNYPTPNNPIIKQKGGNEGLPLCLLRNLLLKNKTKQTKTKTYLLLLLRAVCPIQKQCPHPTRHSR